MKLYMAVPNKHGTYPLVRFRLLVLIASLQLRHPLSLIDYILESRSVLLFDDFSSSGPPPFGEFMEFQIQKEHRSVALSIIFVL